MPLPYHNAHGLFLVIVSFHLNILYDVIQKDTFPKYGSHLLNLLHMSKVYMQMPKSRIIVNQSFNLTSLKSKFLLNCFEAFISNASQ